MIGEMGGMSSITRKTTYSDIVLLYFNGVYFIERIIVVEPIASVTTARK